MNRNRMLHCTVQSRVELLNTLAGEDISVPETNETTKHRERYEVLRILPTLALLDRFEYPLSIEHVDRPDFVLSQPHETIGVETTRAGSEELAATAALAEREIVDHPPLFLDKFKHGTSKRTAKERRRVIRDTEFGPGFGDSGMTADAVKFIMDSVNKKMTSLACSEFRECSRYWLVIYDNTFLTFGPEEELAEAIARELVPFWKKSPRFDCVLLHMSQRIIEFSHQGYDIYPIDDIWTTSQQ